MTQPSQTISARFDGETLRVLDRARERFGDSRGEYMRRTVMSHLHQDESEYVRAQLAELRITSSRLEAKLAGTVTALKKLSLLLLSLERPIEPQQAKRLVVDIFSACDQE